MNEVSQASHDVWWTIGQELEQRGLLNTAEDVFFLSLPELHAALTGETMQQTVQAYHSVYDFELRRRHIPQVLLYDGTEPNAATVASSSTLKA